MVDVEQPDLVRFPALARARGLEVTLEAGDTLWLPAYWWHHVRQLDEGLPNLSLNMWVGTSSFDFRLPSGVGYVDQSTPLIAIHTAHINPHPS